MRSSWFTNAFFFPYSERYDSSVIHKEIFLAFCLYEKVSINCLMKIHVLSVSHIKFLVKEYGTIMLVPLLALVS
jgi:hypothetical protein